MHKQCKSKRKLIGKTALVTGSSAGIGLETARDFALRGARVLMACRNVAKATSAANDIIQTTGNKNIVIYKLDTSSLWSVRECAEQILENEERLDILVNNAGMGGSPRKTLTEDNLEITMATNYYGHFLFTNLLLDLIMKSTPSRIVNVSSEIHSISKNLDPNNLNFENKYCNMILSYAQSKACQILFTKELARRIQSKGVTVNALHPGFVATEIFSKTDSIFAKYMQIVSQFGARDSKSGAQTTIHVAVSEETENITGQFFDDCEITKASSMTDDRELAKQLWRMSIRDVRLRPKEIYY